MITNDATASESGRPPRADAVRNKVRILESAWSLLAERSPHELNMEEVAVHADVGKATLYRHFPTRECLFHALARDGNERIGAALRERISPEADARQKLCTLVTVLYDSYEQHNISIELLQTIRQSRGTADPLDASSDVLVHRIRGILEQGVREGLFRSLDLDYTTLAILHLVSATAFLRVKQRLGLDRQQAEERTTDLLLHAVST